MVKRMILRGPGYDVCSYFYIDGASGRGFLFDPGADADRILSEIKNNNYTIEKIIITHGHYDHIGALDEVRERTGTPAYIHKNGALFLSDPYYNLSGNMTASADGYFEDGDVISTSDGSLELKVIHTPGHTDDSCVFYSEKNGLAFTGDTIFKGTYGNYRFPTGSKDTLMRSIRDKILTLPDNTVLFSGHTDKTTVRNERPYYCGH